MLHQEFAYRLIHYQSIFIFLKDYNNELEYCVEFFPEK